MELWSVVRWSRAVGFSAVSAGLASAGHVAGGGAVEPGPLAVGFLVLLGPALALTGRERTIGGILPVLGASQVVLHFLLSRGATEHAEAAHPAVTDTGHHSGSSGLGMFLMHVVAVLVTAWWLECGEAGLCALARCLAAWMAGPLCLLLALAVPAPPRPVPVWREPAEPRGNVLRHVLVSRGPPVGAVAFG